MKNKTPPERPGIEQFGKDHWSLLAFIEHLCVDHKGNLSDKHRQNFRINIKTHPGYGYFPFGPDGHDWKSSYDTRMKDGSQLPNHDDWDCAEDLEEAELIENVGTGMHPVYKMTENGTRYAAAIRKHKSGGGSFSTFDDKVLA